MKSGQEWTTGTWRVLAVRGGCGQEAIPGLRVVAAVRDAQLERLGDLALCGAVVAAADGVSATPGTASLVTVVRSLVRVIRPLLRPASR